MDESQFKAKSNCKQRNEKQRNVPNSDKVLQRVASFITAIPLHQRLSGV